MNNTEASRAWEYLRRDPAHIEARRTAAEPALEESAPFPLRMQTPADREAAAWGLLAWENPDDETGPASPEAPALAQLLTALDGKLGGESLRQIVVDLYGEARVAEEWSSDGSMRGRVRWRVKQALKLMNGGYTILVAGA